MAETILMLNLKIGLNEEQYKRLKNMALLNMVTTGGSPDSLADEDIKQEVEKLIKSVI